uniref:Uncharacterized protein n=1 Tax=Leptospirillum sp. Group II '5-way CG' TaxID=419541 RepID=B6ALP7_9BACT|nr:MAG: Hypothetical protein CGL2_11277039 [Leptospirillum sp. Group II '5-way CG']
MTGWVLIAWGTRGTGRMPACSRRLKAYARWGGAGTNPGINPACVVPTAGASWAADAGRFRQKFPSSPFHCATNFGKSLNTLPPPEADWSLRPQ